MRKTWILISIICIIATAKAASQSLSHQVLVCAAGLASPTGKSYSQTIGEAAVEVIGYYDHILTQGFQQPSLKITVGPKPSGTGVEAYPNPVIDFVTVELYSDDPHDFYIRIFNLTGTLLLMEEANFSGSYWEKRSIQVSNLARGFYILRVESKDRQINRSFKMEKL